MGKFLNGINGPIVGKVGTVVGSTWKGIPYVKAASRRRTKKVSKKEAVNRDKFGKAQAWLSPLLPFVREGFKGYSLKSEGFVAAKSYLLLNCFEGVAPDIQINPALMKVSVGELPLSANIAVTKTATDRLQFTWDTTYVKGASARDQVMLLAYDVKHEHAYYSITGQFRSAGADTLEIDPKAGNSYHIYVAFTAADRSSQSESVYLGEIAV